MSETTKYSHRNGELEPPALGGKYRFHGKIINTQWLDAPDRDFDGFVISSDTRMSFDPHITFPVGSQCKGQWWGPIPPKEEVQPEKRPTRPTGKTKDRKVLSRKDAWLRRKIVYERHQAGETYATIARDLELSASRIWQLDHSWKRALKGWQEGRGTLPVVLAILPKRSPKYGYA